MNQVVNNFIKNIEAKGISHGIVAGTTNSVVNVKNSTIEAGASITFNKNGGHVNVCSSTFLPSTEGTIDINIFTDILNSQFNYTNDVIFKSGNNTYDLKNSSGNSTNQINLISACPF